MAGLSLRWPYLPPPPRLPSPPPISSTEPPGEAASDSDSGLADPATRCLINAWRDSTMRNLDSLTKYSTSESLMHLVADLAQFWSPSQFFSVGFFEKILELPGGQINVPSPEENIVLIYFSLQLSSRSRTFEGLFELTQGQCLVC